MIWKVTVNTLIGIIERIIAVKTVLRPYFSLSKPANKKRDDYDLKV